MGGQQFRAGAIAVDTSALIGTPRLDEERGLLTMGAGSQWPRVIEACRARDLPAGRGWAIRQKQTGADDMSLGGSVSANAHGRGLGIGPMSEDVESLRLVNARGEVVECSRDQNADLFGLAIGGYGLFGIITEVTLRLTARRKMRRIVDIIDLDDAINAAHRRFAEGCAYGDFQYAIDPSDDSFLRRGVMACYMPAGDDAPLSPAEADLPRERWLELLTLAHTDKARAFALYSQHYLGTHGRVYWSDLMQMSTYIPTYADFLSRRLRDAGPDESLMISELTIPPSELPAFMAAARRILREQRVEDIYGTIRSIRRDRTTFLPWARRDYACVIFNLRTPHTAEGIGRSREASVALTDAALDLDGSFYLTYHRWATRAQVLRAYPQFEEWLELKRRHDPGEVFQSDWYCHYRRMFAARNRAGVGA